MVSSGTGWVRLDVATAGRRGSGRDSRERQYVGCNKAPCSQVSMQETHLARRRLPRPGVVGWKGLGKLGDGIAMPSPALSTLPECVAGRSAGPGGSGSVGQSGGSGLESGYCNSTSRCMTCGWWYIWHVSYAHDIFGAARPGGAGLLGWQRKNNADAIAFQLRLAAAAPGVAAAAAAVAHQEQANSQLVLD